MSTKDSKTKQPCTLQSVRSRYLFGQELIWDSGFGYNLCKYAGESVLYEEARCYMLTGIEKGETIPIPHSELKSYTNERAADMQRKYNGG